MRDLPVVRLHAAGIPSGKYTGVFEEHCIAATPTLASDLALAAAVIPPPPVQEEF